MEYNYNTSWDPVIKTGWKKALKSLKHKPNLHFLEIGCGDGMITNWLLDNILTHKDSRAAVIDCFNSSEIFEYNTSNRSEKIDALKGKSAVVLKTLGKEPIYDFIFIDGTHYREGQHIGMGTFADAILSHPLLKPGGILIFGGHDDSHQTGIEPFMTNLIDQYVILARQPQIILQKILAK